MRRPDRNRQTPAVDDPCHGSPPRSRPHWTLSDACWWDYRTSQGPPCQSTRADLSCLGLVPIVTRDPFATAEVSQTPLQRNFWSFLSNISSTLLLRFNFFLT